MSEDIRQTPSEQPIKFVGSAPPQFREALKNVRNEKTGLTEQKDPFGDVGNIEPIQQQQQQLKQQPKRAKRVASPQLEEILNKLKGHIYDEITLPSKGVFYNGTDGPQNGILNIRPMTGEEEQILAQPKYAKRGQGINMIFRNCVKEVIKPERLLSIDRTYLLIALRNISYGNEYEVEVRCPNCDKKSSHAIRLDQLMVDYCPPEFTPPLTDVLPKSKLNFTWSLSRGTDEAIANEYREKLVKEYGNAAPDDSFLYRLALMIEKIEGVNDKVELMALLKKLPIQDVSYLRNLANEPPFGVDTKCMMTCPLCVYDFDVELPIEAGFFFPRPKKKTETEKETDSPSGDI